LRLSGEVFQAMNNIVERIIIGKEQLSTRWASMRFSCESGSNESDESGL
jgi:hypothetical protein